MKLTILFTVAFCLAFASGKPSLSEVSQDDSFDNYIKMVLDLLRAAMPTGLPDLGIPVLDPFQVPHFDIPHISEGIVQLDARVDNLTVINLATFETRIAHVDLSQLLLQLELFIPLLRADAQYFLDGTIAGLFPLFGEGAMYLELVDLDLSAMAALTLSAEGYVQVGLLELDATISSIKIHFDNLVGGGDFGEAVNAILSLLGTKIWDLVKPSVLGEVNNALMATLNEFLSKCTVNEIIAGQCEFKVFGVHNF